MKSAPQRRRSTVAAAVAVLIGALLGVGLTAPAQARPVAPPAPSAATPTVSGPVSGGSGVPALSLGTFPLASVGYGASEYFFSGTATAYRNEGPLGSDGRWSVVPQATEPYQSRMVVVAPTNPRAFSGTVFVEWLNVSAGADNPADWSLGHVEMLRSGDVYIGVSAQSVGVNALKAIDSVRYGGVDHPGDSYSYDIFSQAGMAVHASAAQILPGMTPRQVIAMGESQSAFRLTTYVNAVAPVTNVYDSYLIHSRSGSGTPLSQAPLADIPVPPVVLTRTDQQVPVLTFQTETDLIVFHSHLARQDDTGYLRLWEVAGTAHADAYVLSVSAGDDGGRAADREYFELRRNPPSSFSVGTFEIACSAPINTGEQHYAFLKAMRDLKSWTDTGIAPRSMPRLELNPTEPVSFALDANGNVRGGVRTPAVDTPVAVLSGLPPADAPGFCRLFGQTTPFTAAQLAAEYPTHGAFVREWRRSVAGSVAAGYLLPEDAATLISAGAQSSVGRR